MTPTEAIGAERAMIACMILHPRAIVDAYGTLQKEDWIDERNAAIADAIFHAWNNGMPADPTVISSVMANRKCLIQLPTETIREVAESAVEDAALAGPEHWSAYVRQIKLASVRRRAQHAGRMLADGAASTVDIEDVLATFESELIELRDSIRVKEPTPGRDVMQRIQSGIEQPESDGEYGTTIIPTGYDRLDRIIRGVKGMTVIALRTSYGKTLIMGNLVSRWAVGGYRPLMFSAEDTEEAFGEKCLASISALNLQHMQYMAREGVHFDKSGLRSAVRAMSAPEWWIDDTPRANVDEIHATARRYVERHGCQVIGIDYLQLLRMRRMRGANRAEVVGEISREIKAIAKSLKVPIVVTAQLGQQLEREARTPKVTDIYESGAIANDADVIILGHKERRESSDGLLLVAKNKRGPLGTVPVVFDLQSQQMDEVPEVEDIARRPLRINGQQHLYNADQTHEPTYQDDLPPTM